MPVNASITLPPGVTLMNPDAGYDAASRTIQIGANITAASASAHGYQLKLDPDYSQNSVTFDAAVVAGEERLVRQLTLPLIGRVFVPAGVQRLTSDW